MNRLLDSAEAILGRFALCLTPSLTIRHTANTVRQIFIKASALCFALSSLADSSPNRCKSTPSSADWPSTESWAALNHTLEGRLINVVPPAAACHFSQPTYNNATCASVQAGWSTYEFHAQDPVSSDWQNWNNDSCLPDSGTQCSGKGYPIYVINASSPTDVQAGVRFGESTWPSVPGSRASFQPVTTMSGSLSRPVDTTTSAAPPLRTPYPSGQPT